MYEQYTYCTTKCFQKQRYLHVHLQTVKCISKVQIWVLHYIVTDQNKLNNSCVVTSNLITHVQGTYLSKLHSNGKLVKYLLWAASMPFPSQSVIQVYTVHVYDFTDVYYNKSSF